MPHLIRHRFSIAAGLCLAQSAQAFDVYTVGGDASCQFAFIQDAIDAAAAHPGEDYVFVASNRTYAQQHLRVTGQDVDIIGGFRDCSDFDPALDQTTISGRSGNSVFEIEGSSHVYLGNLVITGGVLDSSHSGGGIYFGGAGALTLQTSWVFNNQAGYGGGIDVSPSGPTTLNLVGSTVSANTALVSGGGIRVEGQTTLTATHTPSQYNTYIAQNAALGQGDIGYGGGIEVLGPAVANFSAVLDLNSAPYGAGIAALATEHGAAYVNLFTTDPAAPVTVYGNHAAQTGGGIFLKPHAGSSSTAKLCARDFAIDANSAIDGVALYADEDSGHGSIAFFNAAVCDSPPGAVACAAGTACNEINDNVGSNGAALVVESGGALSANHFSARRNNAVDLILFVADTANGAGGDYVHLSNCLLVDNVSLSYLIEGFGAASGTQISLDNCTVAGNQLGTIYAAIRADVNFVAVNNSILYQPNHRTLFFTGSAGDLTAQYILSNDNVAFQGHTGFVNGGPGFVDAANGDYHQKRNSQGVDFAPAIAGSDLDGNPRTLDLVDTPNRFGPMDLGAYEIAAQGDPCSATDAIFCWGFDPEN
ncbi:MAG: hypothetical protein ABIW82_13985 [Dokdonella sp.]